MSTKIIHRQKFSSTRRQFFSRNFQTILFSLKNFLILSPRTALLSVNPEEITRVQEDRYSTLKARCSHGNDVRFHLTELLARYRAISRGEIRLSVGGDQFSTPSPRNYTRRFFFHRKHDVRFVPRASIETQSLHESFLFRKESIHAEKCQLMDRFDRGPDFTRQFSREIVNFCGTRTRFVGRR